ncbi:Transcription factor [Gossypium australe]|uniref:Transcription factor n=1 Tax=Gossypium australe TaxID=47621 RepID=A0A5B6VU83_9ROSI|nr:Transcription factor [Gossypium australe]
MFGVITIHYVEFKLILILFDSFLTAIQYQDKTRPLFIENDDDGREQPIYSQNEGGVSLGSTGMNNGDVGIGREVVVNRAEDAVLLEYYMRSHSEGNWNVVQKKKGLARCRNSCRLRGANH